MKRTLEKLEFIITQTNELALHYDKHVPNDITMFCMCMLDRLNFASEALKILLDKIDQKPQVDFGCGIIIRSLLLDYLIVLNAFEVFGNNISNIKILEKELSNYCLIMLCDSVRNTLDYFNGLEGNIPEALLANLYKNLVASNPNCFEKFDGTRPVIKTTEYISPKKLFQNLVTSKRLKEFKGVYTAYLYYSKYDHFGNMFYVLSRKAKTEQKLFIEKSIEVLPHSLLVVVAILTTFEGQDSFMDIKRKEITSFIDGYRSS